MTRATSINQGRKHQDWVGIGLVVQDRQNGALKLAALQPSIWTTTLRSTLRLFKPCLKIKVTSLTDWYANIIKERKETLCSISKYLVADAWFSKKPFVDQIIEMDMHLISRLRDDADLKYLYLAFNREEGTTM